MSPVRIGIIIGSTRPGRVGDQVARWVLDHAAQRDDAEFELVDLVDYALPHLDEAIPASAGKYANDHTRAWAQKVDSFDGYVFVTPEYNHGYPGVLKNALDYFLPQFKRKPVALVTVSAGGHGGVNAWAQLVTVLVFMGAIVLPQTVAVSKVQDAFGPDGAALEPAYEKRVDGMLAELRWLASRLRG